MRKPYAVAIEGPCCAGKTTLASNLSRCYTGLPVAVVPDYSDFAGGGKNLPRPVAASEEEERAALTFFEDLERRRLQPIGVGSSALHLVLIDRSVHTLLAHCFATGTMSSLPLLRVAEEVLSRSDAPLWPDLVLYLDTPQDVILQRNRGKFPPDIIFMNADFNRLIREYFHHGPRVRMPHIVCIPTTSTPDDICSTAAAAIGRACTL